MNYREKIVFNDLKEKGHDIIKLGRNGYPDFKVISFSENKKFYVEVKSSITGLYSQIQLTYLQEKIFPELINKGEKIEIAIPNDGEILYYSYNKGNLLRKSTYGSKAYTPKTNTCLRKKCGHVWIGRLGVKPRMCPRCKSYKWDEDKKQNGDN